jgi:transporter family protein
MLTTNWRWWALGSALFAALTAILAKVGVTGVASNLATAIRTAVVLLFAWTIVWTTGEARGLPALTARTWLFLALSGLATGLSWLCYFRALQLGEASQVAPVDKLSVVFVLLLAALFLGERLSWQQWLGGGLIAMGAVVLALKPAG